MAETAGNSLIAALRANSAPQAAAGSGPSTLAFPWQQGSGGALVMPNRPAATKSPKSALPPTPPQMQAPTPPTPKTAQDFIDGNFTYEDLKGFGGDNWDRMTGNNPTPTALVLDANKDRVQYADTANPVLNYAQQDPTLSAGMPTASIGRDEYGDKFGLNVGDWSNLPTVEIDAPGADMPAPEAPAAPVAATTPVTDEMSVRQTLEQILADSEPQAIEPPTQVVLPPDVNIPAFDSGINFQMPETLFRSPAPFVPGFTPDADVYAAMQASAPQEIDPSLLAMLGGDAGAPVPATQPVPEEPMYGAEVPWWMLNEEMFLR